MLQEKKTSTICKCEHTPFWNPYKTLITHNMKQHINAGLAGIPNPLKFACTHLDLTKSEILHSPTVQCVLSSKMHKHHTLQLNISMLIQAKSHIKACTHYFTRVQYTEPVRSLAEYSPHTHTQHNPTISSFLRQRTAFEPVECVPLHPFALTKPETHSSAHSQQSLQPTFQHI